VGVLLRDPVFSLSWIIFNPYTA